MTKYWDRVARRAKNTFAPLAKGLNTIGNNVMQTVGNTLKDHGTQIATDALIGAVMLKTGGRVNAKKGKPVREIVHGGEYMLPVGVSPTKKQVQQVNKIKSKAKSTKKIHFI